jgi:hypothetical protein
MSIFFALLPRRRELLPLRRRPLVAAILVAVTAACGRADEPTLKLSESGVAIVPGDAAFLSATLRGREQYDRLVKSNAWAAILDLPAVRRGLDSLEEQRTMPGSPFSMVDTFMQLPENAQAAELLADMVATDTFVYGEPSCIGFLKLLQKVQTVQAAAPLEAIGDAAGDESQAAAIVAALAANLDLVVVPDVVWGFRTTKADAAKSQLKRIEVLLKLVTQANPDLADAVARKKVAGGEVVTFTLRGEQLPWGEIEGELERGLADGVDDAALEKVLDRVKALDVVIGIGLIGDRVVLSIGDSVDHLEKLALPGSGRKGLLATRSFEPLLAHKDKRLTGISYLSGELTGLGDTAGQFASLARLVDEALERGDAPAEAAAGMRQLLEQAGKNFAKRLPEPGPMLAFSFLAEQGYEGYAWNWSRNQPFDGTRRLDLLEHAGGAPLAVAVSRLKADPALLDDLSTLAAGGWNLLKSFVLDDADARERAAEIEEHVAPLVAKFGTILKTKIVPALADGQVGLVIDAKGKTDRLQAELPASSEPLPILEPAIVLPLDDPKLFREGLSDLFELADERARRAGQARHRDRRRFGRLLAGSEAGGPAARRCAAGDGRAARVVRRTAGRRRRGRRRGPGGRCPAVDRLPHPLRLRPAAGWRRGVRRGALRRGRDARGQGGSRARRRRARGREVPADRRGRDDDGRRGHRDALAKRHPRHAAPEVAGAGRTRPRRSRSPPGRHRSSTSIAGSDGTTASVAGSPPNSRGATKTWISSASPAAKSVASTPAPPSTTRFVSRRRPSSARSSRSRPTASAAALCHTSQPAARSAARRSAAAAGPTATSRGASRAVRTSRDSSGSLARESSTIRSGRRGPGGRGVSSGSSASAVPMPMAIASTRPRRAWTMAREAGELIQRPAPAGAASRPSRLIAHFAITHGRPVATSLRKGAVSRTASASSSPVSTVMPAARKAASPPPATAGNGSPAATTTRAMPAAMMACVHGGVLP